MHAVLIGNGFTDIIIVYFSNALRDLFSRHSKPNVLFPQNL